MPQKPVKRRRTLGGIISGSVLTSERFTRRLPIVAFIGLLMLVYMAIGFAVQRRHNYLEKLTREITELRTVSVTTSAMRQQYTRQQHIEQLLVEMNIPLQYNVVPPRVISKGYNK